MEQTFAEKIPVNKRRKIQAWSILANTFGSLSEVMLDNSAILISYVALLGGNESLNMLMAGATGFIALLLQIPCGILAEKIGLKKSMYLSCTIGCFACLLMAIATITGGLAKYVVVGLCFVYCIARPIFSASWFPIVDSFVAPSERGSYFGFLRFIYTIFAGAFFFLVARAMGENPPIWLLQILIAICAVLQFARAIFVYFLELQPQESNKQSIVKSIKEAMANSCLVSFAVYMMFVAIIAFLIQPLTLVYLKQTLGYGVSTVQTVATFGITGSIVGYLTFGKLLKTLGSRYMLILIHLLFITITASLFFSGKNLNYLYEFVCAVIFVNCMNVAWFFCFSSAEMYSVANPKNRVISLAFFNTFFSGGRMFGGFLSSILLASGMLATTWQKGDMIFSAIQSIFAIACFLSLLWLLLLFIVPAVNGNRQNDYYQPPNFEK
ncbi:MAG: MFS transporter [Verrucomicrobiaceae bacterium]|nr:MFS transporter [Verrucomicrobiaceae bacterium]